MYVCTELSRLRPFLFSCTSVNLVSSPPVKGHENVKGVRQAMIFIRS